MCLHRALGYFLQWDRQSEREERAGASQNIFISLQEETFYPNNTSALFWSLLHWSYLDKIKWLTTVNERIIKHYFIYWEWNSAKILFLLVLVYKQFKHTKSSGVGPADRLSLWWVQSNLLVQLQPSKLGPLKVLSFKQHYRNNFHY